MQKSLLEEVSETEIGINKAVRCPICNSSLLFKKTSELPRYKWAEYWHCEKCERDWMRMR